MYRCAPWLGIGLVVGLIAGCGEGGPPVKMLPSSPVKGTVNLDGRPMASGEVMFSIPGEPLKSFPVTNGTFSGVARDGKNRVEVVLMRPAPPPTSEPPPMVNAIPARFNSATTLSADVTKGGANEFKFDVMSR